LADNTELGVGGKRTSIVLRLDGRSGLRDLHRL